MALKLIGAGIGNIIGLANSYFVSYGPSLLQKVSFSIENHSLRCFLTSRTHVNLKFKINITITMINKMFVSTFPNQMAYLCIKCLICFVTRAFGDFEYRAEWLYITESSIFIRKLFQFRHRIDARKNVHRHIVEHAISGVF